MISEAMTIPTEDDEAGWSGEAPSEEMINITEVLASVDDISQR